VLLEQQDLVEEGVGLLLRQLLVQVSVQLTALETDL